MMISVLLMQDVIAIVLIVMLSGGQAENVDMAIILLLMKLIVLSAVAFFLVKYVINNFFRHFDIIQEYVFLLAIGWWLLGAGVAEFAGLSYELGAFIAGVAFASSPVSSISTTETVRRCTSPLITSWCQSHNAVSTRPRLRVSVG